MNYFSINFISKFLKVIYFLIIKLFIKILNSDSKEYLFLLKSILFD